MVKILTAENGRTLLEKGGREKTNKWASSLTTEEAIAIRLYILQSKYGLREGYAALIKRITSDIEKLPKKRQAPYEKKLEQGITIASSVVEALKVLATAGEDIKEKTGTENMYR
ncbi:MAG: hypothetical protein ABIH83_03695 [Candidatus Micrarchaeota archaeon]